MEEEKNDDSRVMIFGYSRSRLEVFLNGIVFLIIQISQEVFEIVSQLPENWKEEDLAKVDRPILIPTILFIMSYYLINLAFFGGVKSEKLQERFGTSGTLIRKYSLTLTLLAISIFIPIYIIITFF
jgi:hypothetical protein